MAVADEEFVGVAGHGHVTRSFQVVPFKVHTGNFFTLTVLSDDAVLLEDVKEVKGVVFANIFSSKVIYNKGE